MHCRRGRPCGNRGRQKSGFPRDRISHYDPSKRIAKGETGLDCRELRCTCSGVFRRPNGTSGKRDQLAILNEWPQPVVLVVSSTDRIHGIAFATRKTANLTVNFLKSPRRTTDNFVQPRHYQSLAKNAVAPRSSWNSE